MTLMNPKSTRTAWQKNTRTCHSCNIEFPVDGRGKRLYCPKYSHKKRAELNRQTYFNRKKSRGIIA